MVNSQQIPSFTIQIKIILISMGQVKGKAHKILIVNQIRRLITEVSNILKASQVNLSAKAMMAPKTLPPNA
jgi:hypothetical protein